jgi:DNA excision repair protein ERCC-4
MDRTRHVSDPKPIRIVVDDREQSSQVVTELRKMGNIQLTIERMAVGDYAIDGRLLVERKRISDLVDSIKERRLFHQASRLASSPLRAALIIEGTSAGVSNVGIRRDAIQGALVMMTIKLGIPILRAMDPAESARLMVFAAKQTCRQASVGFPRSGNRPKGKQKMQIHILQGLPGVGPARALRLIERFHSVEAVIAAGVDELEEVAGMGRKTAEAIRKAVTD